MNGLPRHSAESHPLRALGRAMVGTSSADASKALTAEQLVTLESALESDQLEVDEATNRLIGRSRRTCYAFSAKVAPVASEADLADFTMGNDMMFGSPFWRVSDEASRVHGDIDRVLLQGFQWYNVKGLFVRGSQDHRC